MPTFRTEIRRDQDFQDIFREMKGVSEKRAKKEQNPQHQGKFRTIQDQKTMTVTAVLCWPLKHSCSANQTT